MNIPLRVGEARKSMVVLVKQGEKLVPYVVTNPKAPYPDGMGASRQLIVAEPESGVGKRVCLELCSWENSTIFRESSV